MTKLQSATEPSMEDILASIRKMISEERLGPRPVPEPTARATIADAASEPLIAVAEEVDVEAEASAADDRQEPSFSSLSDALKAAKPSAQRRTLEEKIADMLESRLQGESDTTEESGAPAEPLAVFGPKKPLATTATDVPAAPTVAPRSPASSDAARGDASPRGPGLPGSTSKPGGADAVAGAAGASKTFDQGPLPTPRSDRPRREESLPKPFVPPIVAARGMRPSISDTKSTEAKGAGMKPAEAKGADSKEVDAKASEAQSPETKTPETKSPETKSPETKSAETKSAEGLGREAKSSEPGGTESKKSEPQRIIAMPPRPSLTLPAEPAGPPNGSGLNGASMSGLGMRPGASAPYGPRPAPLPRDVAGKPASDDAAAREEKPKEPPADQRAEGPTARDAKSPGGEPPAPAAATESGFASQAPKPAAAQSLPPRFVDKEGIAPVAGERPKAPPPPAAEKLSAKPTLSAAPSEALVDAVVDLVHRQPHSLSVFTSGSDFIHGVGGRTEVRAPSASDTPPTQKLDRSAAELLRPMLRQWLAENMPRIVEEALRSELQSSQDTGKGSDKA